MSTLYDEIDVDSVTKIRDSVEDNYHILDEIVSSIVEPYCKELDRYVSFIRSCLRDGNSAPTDAELEDFCMNLSTYIYFASSMCERMGLKDDIAKAVYKETYHAARSSQEKGTVSDKDSFAELYSRQELLTSICFNRAFKIMRSKVDSAQELLSSCKKVLTRRIQQMQLTQIGA